jgi:hypothetical protein
VRWSHPAFESRDTSTANPAANRWQQLARIPVVLRSDLYALAALAGAASVVIADLLGAPTVLAAIGGGVLCFALRLMAMRKGWRLPTAGGEERPPRDNPD